ncbi:MAG: AraC family transcriptional regulator ligand-binding domain-containing protein, partial [Gammaproteobacteria bacterium]|nr:AraC family transcriptional regulator ligand-binding domain-containing protein [Gammaproteobacteria bacterium]
MPHSAPLTVSAALVLDLYDALLRLEILTPEQLAARGVQRDALVQVDARWPVTIVHRLWQLAREAGGPPELGLLIGQHINAQAQGALAHLVAHAETLGEALQWFQQRMALMNEGERLQVRQLGEQVSIVHHFVDPLQNHRMALERSLSALVTRARHFTGLELRPVRAHFRHAPVRYLAAYRALFGEDLHFRQAEDALFFSREVLNHPILGSDAYLRDVLRQRVERLASQLGEQTLSETVRQLLIVQLGRVPLRVDHLAAQLHMSRQTLHRRLQQEGTHFRDLLTAVRRQRVQELLADPNCRIEALPQQLGYTEASAFFKV